MLQLAISTTKAEYQLSNGPILIPIPSFSSVQEEGSTLSPSLCLSFSSSDLILVAKQICRDVVMHERCWYVVAP